MRALLFVFCLFTFVNEAAAQSDTLKKVDTGEGVVYRFHDVSNITAKTPLYIVDEKFLPDSLSGQAKFLNKFNPSDIFSVLVLKDAEANALYGVRAINGVVIIKTKAYAIAQYQKKLGAFSSKYKHYVQREMKYNHNDNGIIYMIFKGGNSIVILKDDNRINELYNLRSDKIKKVDFNIKETCCGTTVSTVITEKSE